MQTRQGQCLMRDSQDISVIFYKDCYLIISQFIKKLKILNVHELLQECNEFRTAAQFLRYLQTGKFKTKFQNTKDESEELNNLLLNMEETLKQIIYLNFF